MITEFIFNISTSQLASFLGQQHGLCLLLVEKTNLLGIYHQGLLLLELQDLSQTRNCEQSCPALSNFLFCDRYFLDPLDQSSFLAVPRPRGPVGLQRHLLLLGIVLDDYRLPFRVSGRQIAGQYLRIAPPHLLAFSDGLALRFYADCTDSISEFIEFLWEMREVRFRLPCGL
jgi:hypothetical protein